MSRKHVEEYFNKIADQYMEMVNDLKEFEEECSTSMVEPEKFESMKKMIEPLKNNYMTWSYMMYLLNLPNNKNKEKKVLNHMKKEDLEEMESHSGLDENRGILNEIKGVNN